MPPLLFSALRSILVLPLLFFVPRPKCWKTIFLMGLLIGTLKLPLMLFGIHLGLSAGLASLLSQTHVFFTILLAMFWLNEWPNKQNWISIIIASAGICLIISQVEGTVSTFYGLGVILLSAFFWSISNIATRKTSHLNIIHLTLWMNIIPPLPLLGLSWYLYGGAPLIESLTDLSVRTIFSVLYATFLSGVAGYCIWGFLLRTYPTSTVIHFSLLTPVSAMLFGFLLLNEVPDPLSLIGAGLIFSGLLFNQMNLKRKVLSAEKIIEE